GRRHVPDYVELSAYDTWRLGGIGRRIPGAIRSSRTVPHQRCGAARRILVDVRRSLAILSATGQRSAKLNTASKAQSGIGSGTGFAVKIGGIVSRTFGVADAQQI